jgi:lipopolysaccharide transport system ATP-binding protein
MQVRLAFSTAIQTDPDILLVDEVLAVGDLEFQAKCNDKFVEFKNKGVTLLIVSHDLNAIKRFCSRTLLLSNGEQVAIGASNEIVDRYIQTRQKNG